MTFRQVSQTKVGLLGLGKGRARVLVDFYLYHIIIFYCFGFDLAEQPQKHLHALPGSDDWRSNPSWKSQKPSSRYLLQKH